MAMIKRRRWLSLGLYSAALLSGCHLQDSHPAPARPLSEQLVSDKFTPIHMASHTAPANVPPLIVPVASASVPPPAVVVASATMPPAVVLRGASTPPAVATVALPSAPPAAPAVGTATAAPPTAAVAIASQSGVPAMESAVLEFVRKAAPTTVQSANAPSPRPALAVPQHYSPVDVKPTPQLAASDAPRPSKPPVPPGPEPVLPRSPATESPSHDHQGHAEDYHWIRGTVSKWRNEWRLRYAAVDQVDPYGGSLPLVGDEHLSQLKDNGCYLLQGYVVLHDSRLGGPAFYVEAVKN